MRAAYISTTGAPDVLQFTDSYPKPVRQPGEVLVRIHAASVNPVDVKTRTGAVPILAMKMPQVPPPFATSILCVRTFPTSCHTSVKRHSIADVFAAVGCVCARYLIKELPFVCRFWAVISQGSSKRRTPPLDSRKATRCVHAPRFHTVQGFTAS